jgi:hypothetical protein
MFDVFERLHAREAQRAQRRRQVASERGDAEFGGMAERNGQARASHGGRDCLNKTGKISHGIFPLYSDVETAALALTLSGRRVAGM